MPEGAVLCFFGDLGAGKTTLIKGIAASAGVPVQQVNSPTFVYMNLYEGSKSIVHFDLYRLENATQFLSMGFDEYLFNDAIVCIEWSERIKELLPDEIMEVTMEHKGEGVREIQVCSKGRNEVSL